MLKFIIAVLLMSSISYGEFILDSLDEAKQLSQSTQQPILVIFGSEHCSFCKKLINDAHNDKLKTAMDPYIICYLDINKDAKLKEEYKINIVPDSRIIEKNIQKTKIVGYNKENYIKWLIDNK